MKKLTQTILFSLAIFTVGCKKEAKDQPNITIKTSKTEYIVNSKIYVTLTNNLNRPARYFQCDNVDLSPSQILKMEDAKWIDAGYSFVCTAMGPMGYSGILDIAETKQDSLTLSNVTGKFKLRYKFVADKDTLEFDSNEFHLRE